MAVWEGTIVDADGEREGRGRRGSIPARQFTTEGLAGEALEVIHAPRPDSTNHRFVGVREISPHSFDTCPICLTPGPRSVEHLPPARLGGAPMTMTCERCNNSFGRVEAELIDWRDDAIRRASVTADGIVGARRLPRILERWTPTGEFVLLVDGPLHPEAEPMLQGTEFSLEISPPAPHLYKLAALKQAYLAACLELQAIPRTPTAVMIRQELMAARDALSRRQIPSSGFVLSMPIMRTHGQPKGPAVALGLIPREDDRAEWWIALASSIAVPWPFQDACPAI